MDTFIGRFYLCYLRTRSTCYSDSISTVQRASPISHRQRTFLPISRRAQRWYGTRPSSTDETSQSASREKKPRWSTSRATRRGARAKVFGKEAKQGEDQSPRKREPWQIQKEGLKKKFGDEAWQPRKRLSPDAIEGIRALHASDAEKYPTEVLASQFEVTPDAIRRILKSKWVPTEAEAEDRKQRWDKRGEAIWTRMAELGVRPPKKWREMGINQQKWGKKEKEEPVNKEWRKQPSHKEWRNGPRRNREEIPWEEDAGGHDGSSVERGFGIPGRRIGDLV
ncbi:MAG: Required for respiratory growth protein 9 mitochondrial [Vezdaea aestivalis]|nr:MAG: Required for respiratory growth protein 9 mitochondrial [Vezdaea aestivalis]